MQTWTKKDKIACIFIFTIAILTFVTFLSTITLSYFYDRHTVNDILTAGKVSITVSGGPNNDGVIKFPDAITPYTSYDVVDYESTGSVKMVDRNLAYQVTNTSTSGAVFLMVQVTSNMGNLIMPSYNMVSTGIGSKYWYYGNPSATYPEGNSATNYYFYYEPLGKGATSKLFATSWYVGNIGNDIAGSDVSITITAHAIQVQGGAVKVAGGVWGYIPPELLEIYETYF